LHIHLNRLLKPTTALYRIHTALDAQRCTPPW
jgi:hypothetical protein